MWAYAFFLANVLCVPVCVCVCFGICLYAFILVFYCVCACVCVCLTDFQQSSDQPGTSPRQQGQSHSLIILTFLHNDPMHNSPFSVFCSLPPSICPTDAYHLTLSIYFFLDLMALLTSFFLPPTLLSVFNPQQFSRLLTLLLYVFLHFSRTGCMCPIMASTSRTCVRLFYWMCRCTFFILWIPVYVCTILLHNFCTLISFIHYIWRRMILIKLIWLIYQCQLFG